MTCRSVACRPPPRSTPAPTNPLHPSAAARDHLRRNVRPTAAQPARRPPDRRRSRSSTAAIRVALVRSRPTLGRRSRRKRTGRPLTPASPGLGSDCQAGRRRPRGHALAGHRRHPGQAFKVAGPAPNSCQPSAIGSRRSPCTAPGWQPTRQTTARCDVGGVLPARCRRQTSTERPEGWQGRLRTATPPHDPVTAHAARRPARPAPGEGCIRHVQ